MRIEFYGEEPKVLIEPAAAADINDIIHLSHEEVGWLGHVRKVEDLYIIDSIYVPKQEVHSATTEIAPEGLIACMEDTGWDSIGLWGHSHVNMSPGASGQDDSQFIKLLDETPFFIRHIANKKGEYSLALYDGERGVIVYDMRFSAMWNRKDHWKDVLKERVSKKELPTIITYGGHNHNVGFTTGPKKTNENENEKDERLEKKLAQGANLGDIDEDEWSEYLGRRVGFNG